MYYVEFPIYYAGRTEYDVALATYRAGASES